MAEALLDDLIEGAMRFVSKNRTRFLVLLAVLVAMGSGRIIDYVETSIVGPVRTSLTQGLTSRQVGHAVALGVSSGLSAPGLTMVVLVGLARLVGDVDAPTLAIAAAINAALTIPDLFLWNAVFARIGSSFIPGGRYIRPFVAGTIPWMLCVAPMYSVLFVFGSAWVHPTLVPTK